MKVIKMVVKILTLLIGGFIILICSSDLIHFYFNSEIYLIGSEVIDKVGLSYRSNLSFISFNSIMIAISIVLSFSAIKSKNIKTIIIILLIVLCQIACMILL